MKTTSSHYFCYRTVIHGQSKSVAFRVFNEAENLKGIEVAVPVVGAAVMHVRQRWL